MALADSDVAYTVLPLREEGETLADIWTRMVETSNPTTMVVSSGVVQENEKMRLSQLDDLAGYLSLVITNIKIWLEVS